MTPKRGMPSPRQDPHDGERAFDQWLGRQLARAYDEVLSEEVPEDLKRLVRAFEEKMEAGERMSERGASGRAGQDHRGERDGSAGPVTPGSSDD